MIGADAVSTTTRLAVGACEYFRVFVFLVRFWFSFSCDFVDRVLAD